MLGQMQHPAAIESLAGSLARTGEHGMVRHESAEALGAIEGTDAEWARCEAVLRQYLNDPDTVVGESCQVALDAADYWARADEFGEDGVKGFAELKRLSEQSGSLQSDQGASCPLRGHFNITTPNWRLRVELEGIATRARAQQASSQLENCSTYNR